MSARSVCAQFLHVEQLYFILFHFIANGRTALSHKRNSC